MSHASASQGPSVADETTCRFVSSRGILKSCTLRAKNPASSVSKIPRDMQWPLVIPTRKYTVYLCTDMIKRFVRRFLPLMVRPFVLVTGDSDRAVSTADIDEQLLVRLLGHDKLIAWHAQNLAMRHEKLHAIPIGLDYHSVTSGDHPWGPSEAPTAQESRIREIGKTAGAFHAKELRAFSNWHFQRDRGDRLQCQADVHPDAVFYQPSFLPRTESWRLNARYAFTLSPFGIGMDCHRTWEALILGSIPIVLRSSLQPLFEGLPVVVVDAWSEVTPERLAAERQRILGESFRFDRLELAYWLARINGRRWTDAPAAPLDAFTFGAGAWAPGGEGLAGAAA